MTTTINASTSSGLVNTADTSGILQLQTASTAALTITAAQNVAIGTTATTQKLWVDSGYVAITNDYGFGFHSNPSAGSIQNYYSGNDTSNYLRMLTNGTERMRIDSSGNVGIGTSSPTEKVTVAGAVIATGGASSLARDAAIVDFSANSARFIAGRAGGNYGSWQALIAGASGVTLRYKIDYDSTTQWFAADGTTERMRITSDGNLNVNRQITSFTTNGFGVFGATNTVTVADAATITLSGGSSSQLISLTCASSGTGGAFFANYNTTVSQIGGSSTSISTTDAGTVDIAIYKSANSNTVTFKNRSGQSKVYRIAIFCGENGGTV
jgi:hypothetical protein